MVFAGLAYYALFIEPYHEGRADRVADIPEIGQFLEELPLEGPVRYWVMDNGSRGAWGYVHGRTDPERFAAMAEQREWQSVEAEPSMVRSFHRLATSSLRWRKSLGDRSGPALAFTTGGSRLSTRPITSSLPKKAR